MALCHMPANKLAIAIELRGVKSKGYRLSRHHSFLGATAPANLGEYYRAAQRRADIVAQHGPVRVLFKDGKPVDQTIEVSA